MGKWWIVDLYIGRYIDGKARKGGREDGWIDEEPAGGAITGWFPAQMCGHGHGRDMAWPATRARIELVCLL